jgi:hypothetical protein
MKNTLGGEDVYCQIYFQYTLTALGTPFKNTLGILRTNPSPQLPLFNAKENPIATKEKISLESFIYLHYNP